MALAVFCRQWIARPSDLTCFHRFILCKQCTLDFIRSRVLAAANEMASGLLFVFITSPILSANSPIKFGETKTDSVASGSANLANSCARFAETDLADQLTAVQLPGGRLAIIADSRVSVGGYLGSHTKSFPFRSQDFDRNA